MTYHDHVWKYEYLPFEQFGVILETVSHMDWDKL